MTNSDTKSTIFPAVRKGRPYMRTRDESLECMLRAESGTV
jgi:hypothetical protein